MARQFNMNTVFRAAERTLLREFFKRFGVDVTGEINWESTKTREIEVFQKLFDSLPKQKRNSAESTLRHIHAIACENGMEALADAATKLMTSEQWNEYFHSETNLYTKSLAAWLDNPEIFDTAYQFLQVESLAWWRKRVDLPKIMPLFDDDTKSALQNAIQEFFREQQGRGFVCTVEMRERANGTYYFFAYPDDYVQDTLSHDEHNTLVHKTIRQTFEVVFAYDSIEGSSDLHAKIPKKLREQLEAIFLKHILDVSPQKDEREPYQLNMLLDPDFTLHAEPEDGVSFNVTALTLSWTDQKEDVTFYSRLSRTARERAMGSTLQLPIQCATVTQAKIRMERRPPEGGRKQSLTFDVKTPFSCTLKNQNPELVELAHKYLKQWGIEHDTEITKSVTNSVREAALPVVG
ncbi:MAG: hypothetical protein ACRC2T_09450 [Thermoguttaceae bacterium]